MKKQTLQNEGTISKGALYLMSISAGLVVANLYYNQPLLNQIANSFQVNETAVSNIPLFTQFGYAIGLLAIVPLGDMVANIKILKIDFAVIILALLAAATAQSVWWLNASSLLIGASSAIPQLFVPLAAQLSAPKDQGRATGMVMSGLLIGIIGSRVISGFVGEVFGWRTIYYAGSTAMAFLFIALYIKLPRTTPHYNGRYKTLIKSLWYYVRTEPILRMATLRGALSFAGLSAFWTTLTFLLEDNFGYGSDIIGLFGLLGVIGALGASVGGKLNDRYNKDRMIYASVVLLVLSWTILFVSANWLVGLVVGVILVDLAQQILNITNQNIIFNNNPEARNRVNTIYMVLFFIGGALGTWLGARAYVAFGWKGVSGLGILLSVGIAITHYIFVKRFRND